MTYTSDDGRTGGKVSRGEDIFSDGLAQAIFESICDVPIPTLAIPRIMALMAAEREREGREVAEAIKRHAAWENPDNVFSGWSEASIIEEDMYKFVDGLIADRYGQGIDPAPISPLS